MLRSRFLGKLYASYATLILVTAAAVGLLVGRWIETDSLREMHEALEARATLLRAVAWPALAGQSDPRFQKEIQGLGKAIGTRLTVIRADGVVIADSEEDPARMDNHANRPEILEVLVNDRPGEAKRYSTTRGIDMMYLALPLREEGRLLGFARAAIPLRLVEERRATLRHYVMLGAGVAAALGLLLALAFARQVTVPLRSMTRVAEAIAGGDYDQRGGAAGRDEFGQLGRALNVMARELHERLETLTRDHNKLSAILGGMVEGVVAVDQDERIVHLNDVARRLLGVPREGGVGKPVWQVTRLRDVSEILGRTMRSGQEIRDDLRVPVGARDAVIRLLASPLRDGEGRVSGAVLVLHDVTELRRLEEVRRDFVANVSHELKTPLTAIRGLVETLLDDEAMDPGQRQRFLTKIRDQAGQMATLVNDLLVLSSVESSSGALGRELLDVREAATESARMLRPAADARRQTLAVELPDAPVRVLGDEKGLQQIFGNLLDNAIKYTPDGGRIRLRLRAEGEHAWIEVQDTGVGIEPRDRDRIFERFYRVDKGRSRALGGTGLGLSIVKHVAMGLGGEVTVESTPGQGSTFQVRLPLAAPVAC